MEVDALHTQDFSYDQAHQVFHMHHETACDQLDAQRLTDGSEQMAEESGLHAMTKGKGKGDGKGGPTFQGTCHHCGQFGHKLVICPEKDAESSFDPRKANKRDGRDRREEREWKREFGERADGKQAVGRELRVQQVALGAEAKEAEWDSKERERVGSTKLHKGPPMLAWSGSETTQTQATYQGWNQCPWLMATVGFAFVSKDSCQ